MCKFIKVFRDEYLWYLRWGKNWLEKQRYFADNQVDGCNKQQISALYMANYKRKESCHLRPYRDTLVPETDSSFSKK